MMKSSTLFVVGHRPPPPTSTSRPPDVIHVTSVPRPSLFFASSASVYYIERKPKNEKRGRPGNEASIDLFSTKHTDFTFSSASLTFGLVSTT